MPLETSFEVGERIGVAGDRAANDEWVDEDFEFDEGFEPRDFEEALWGLSSDGVFESDGVDCNKNIIHYSPHIL